VSTQESVLPGELETRRARVRGLMAAEGLDALVVLAPDSQFWLCGLESFISGVLAQALVLPADEGAPTALVMWDADVPLARATTDVDQVVAYRFGVEDPVPAFRRAVAECCPDARTIGFDSGSRAVPHSIGVALIEALAPARCVDALPLLAEARLVKSEHELACLRRAGAFANTGLEAAVEYARPGVTERQLAAEIEYAARSAGSDYPSIPTELASGRRSAFVHGTPSHRRLEPGDLVHVELGGVEQRYNAVGLLTFYVGGAPPSRAGVRLYGVVKACLEAGLEALAPGVEARAVEAPALELLRAEGLGDGFQMRFGYGVGVGYPPTWLDPFQITRTSRRAIEPGVAFVLHACLLDAEAEVGVVIGGTYAMTGDGVEELAGAGPVDLQPSLSGRR